MGGASGFIENAPERFAAMKIAALRSLVVALLIAPAIAPIYTYAWGNEGHVYVNRVAAQDIPESMPAFLRTGSAIERIAYLGPEPDRWRGASEYALDNAQSPDHFIDLERIEGLGDLPRGRYEFYRMLYRRRAETKTNADDYLPERVGLQPYITIEIFERLTVAFRDYRKLLAEGQPTGPVEADIVFYAGWLGHYVADGSQPLHTTINYDGWVAANPQGFTTEHGIHRRFETDFVNRNITAIHFAALVVPPQRLSDPFQDYLKYLLVSHDLVNRVYELDKANALSGGESGEAIQFIEQRLAAGAQMLVNLWYTAWLESAE